MEEYKWLFTLPALSIIAQIGMFSNFLKKNVKGETLVEIKGYFSNNFKSTFLALVITQITTMTVYFTLATGQTIDLITVFGVGYMCDSGFNKWDKKA
jgi:hypothetical protein